MNEQSKINRLPIVKGISEAVAERANHPRNFGPLPSWNGHARITGPCGDTMEYWIWIDSQEYRIIRLGFVTDGCGLSRAAGSMAGELVEGASSQEALSIEQSDVLKALDGLPLAHEHCALLAANTLKAAIRDFEKNS